MANFISIKNKYALRSYELLDQYKAGIKLLGEEVKALREGKGNLRGSHIKRLEDGLYIVDFNISKFSKSSNKDYKPKRVRKLLLNKQEISKIKSALAEKGRAVIPIEVYLEGALVKIKIAIAKGLKTRDKKNIIKQKQQEMDAKREIKNLGY